MSSTPHYEIMCTFTLWGNAELQAGQAIVTFVIAIISVDMVLYFMANVLDLVDIL